MTDLVDRIFQDRVSLFWVVVLQASLAVIIATFYITASLHFPYTPDDAYIYFQYARNIAQGEGFSFNAGSPSYGVTGPLWALFIAVGSAIKLDPYIVAKSFDLVFASLSILLAHLITFLLTRDRIYATAGALLVAVDVWLLRWAGSGMETSFAVFMLLMSVRFIVTREYALAAFGAALLVLLRPEGCIVLALACIHGFISAGNSPRPWKTRAMIACFAFVPLVPWLVYSLWKFGSILPNTLAAKTGPGFVFTDSVESILQASAMISASQAVSLILLVTTFVFVLRFHGWKYLLREGSPAFLPFVLVASFGIIAANVVSRYVVPFLPLVPIYALWGLKHVEIQRQWQWQRTLTILVVIALMTTAQNSFVYGTRVLPHLSKFSQGMEECFKPLGYWLRNKTSPDAVVLAHDIGMIAYISERTFYDAPGLISPELRRSRGVIPADEMFRTDSLWKFVRPNYIIDRAERPERLKSETLRPEITCVFPGLGIQSPDTLFYTIYRVIQ